MENILLRFQELATAAKFTMIVDQVLMLMEREIDKELKLEEKFRDLCSEMASTVKNKVVYIEDLERYPWLQDNVEATETARVLKYAQKRNMEKVTGLQIMMDQSLLGVHEKLIFVQKLKDGMLGYGLGRKGLCCVSEMAPSGLDALLFDVHNDGVFFFVPLWFEIVQYDFDLEAMCEFADAYGKL
ncbi:hypothetical protein Tco_1468954, partial [Tanacetum coccineum]